MTSTIEGVPTKSVEEKIAKRIRVFLKKFVAVHFTDPDKPSGIDQAKARHALGISQGYLSDLLNDKKSPSLNVVLGLREATGASFEEITGHKPPLRPRYPLSLLASDPASIDEAVREGRAHERPSGTSPAAIKRPSR